MKTLSYEKMERIAGGVADETYCQTLGAWIICLAAFPQAYCGYQGDVGYLNYLYTTYCMGES